MDLSDAETEGSKHALNLHLENLVSRYGKDVTILDLLPFDRNDCESLGRIFEATLLELNRSGYEYLHYDGAKILHGDKSILEQLKRDIAKHMEKQGYFAATLNREGRVSSAMRMQSGVFRLNGINCVDTSNLVQQQIGQEIFENMIDFISQSFSNAQHSAVQKPLLSFNQSRNLSELWIANGNAISLQYIGTPSFQSANIVSCWWNPFQSTTVKIARSYLATFQYDKRQEALELVVGPEDGGDNWNEDPNERSREIIERRARVRAGDSLQSPPVALMLVLKDYLAPVEVQGWFSLVAASGWLAGYIALRNLGVIKKLGSVFVRRHGSSLDLSDIPILPPRQQRGLTFVDHNNTRSQIRNLATTGDGPHIQRPVTQVRRRSVQF